MTHGLNRREMLVRMWKAGFGLIAVAGAWTAWDALRPGLPVGFGGEVKTVAPNEVPTDSVLTVTAARGYLTRVGDEVVALSEKCPHLGCRVEWCERSGEFECACHGSAFNRLGEHRKGPSPRGMSRYPVSAAEGVVVINTGEVIDGAPPGAESIDEPVRGPSCAAEE